MGQNFDTREIDGFSFTVSQLPAMKGLLLLHRLTKAIGPALAKVAGAFTGGSVKLSDLDVAALAGAVESLFANLPASDFEAITKELLSTATIEVDGKRHELFKGGNSGNFDLYLQGKMGTIFKLIAFAFEVNYGNFFGWAKGAFASAFAEARTKSAATPSKD